MRRRGSRGCSWCGSRLHLSRLVAHRTQNHGRHMLRVYAIRLQAYPVTSVTSPLYMFTRAALQIASARVGNRWRKPIGPTSHWRHTVGGMITPSTAAVPSLLQKHTIKTSALPVRIASSARKIVFSHDSLSFRPVGLLPCRQAVPPAAGCPACHAQGSMLIILPPQSAWCRRVRLPCDAAAAGGPVRRWKQPARQGP